MHIVIIDDDEDTQEILKLYLEPAGFQIHSAFKGIDGIRLTQLLEPDGVIVDIQLPDMPGWGICRDIRRFSNVPILIISAVAQDDTDIIRGLNLGADDYLLKPFKPQVLKARLEAVLRRSSETAWRSGRYMYIDPYLKVDLYREEVFAGGARVLMSYLEYRLLELLVIHAGQPVPMLEIIESLWGGQAGEEYAQCVRIYIGRLRKHINPPDESHQYIITEHGFGYCFDPRN